MDINLDQMTVEEKLKLMERIWDNLSIREENIPSPHWHKDILVQREEGVKKGEEAAEDWEIAKKKIRDSLS